MTLFLLGLELMAHHHPFSPLQKSTVLSPSPHIPDSSFSPVNVSLTHTTLVTQLDSLNQSLKGVRMISSYREIFVGISALTLRDV